MDPLSLIMFANAAVKLGLEIFEAFKDDPRVPAEVLDELKQNLATVSRAVADYHPRDEDPS